MTLTVGSLFSGIGGLDLGLERAGMKVAWQVEKDPYAQKVLRKHWPDVLLGTDIRDVYGKPHAGFNYPLPPVDLICGGFPCQDISVAGRGAGLNGTRSGLWREFHRIIDEVRPKWVLIENVPALRSRGLDVVLRDLSASGYDAEWDCLPAAAFGAYHKRDRIFVVAYSQRRSVRVESRWGGRADGEGSALLGFSGKAWPLASPQPWPALTDMGRSVHGLPHRVDRLRCLGNAVVPQVAEHVGRLIVEAERG